MKVIRKSTLFRGAEIGMSEEEYKAYKFGRFYGIVDGMILGIILSAVVFILT